MRAMRVGVVGALAALVNLSATADEGASGMLSAIVVTATRQSEAVRDVQASVEVIDRERIDRYADGNVPQLLMHAAGVQASNNGTTGDVAIRGFNRSHTLILVDGLRRTNNYGSNNPAQIGLVDIERIEIVRGPLSSLYGSEALGGVVNVITRHPGANPGASVLLNTGSANRGRETFQSGVNFRTGNKMLGHSFTIEQNYRGSLRHRDSVSDDFGRLNDWAASYRGRWQPDTANRVDWALEAFDRDSRASSVGTSGPYTRFEDERRYFGSLSYVGEVGPGELTLRGGFGRSKGATNRAYPTVETTLHRQAQGDAVYQFYPHDAHAVSFGIGALRDDLDVSINSRRAVRNNRFALLQDQWQIDPGWKLVAGVRLDHFDDFGTTTNPRISLGWSDVGWSARVGYGTAFRAPSLLEQYSSFVRGRLLIRGNPELKPEESKSWEAMVRREFPRGHIELTIHRNTVKQLIESVPTTERVGSLAVVEYRNINEARINGVELGAALRPTAAWDMSVGLDLIDARDVRSGVRLSGRARQVWRLESSYRIGSWQLNARARHMADYLATGINAPRGSAPYNTNLTRVDLSARYAYRPGTVFSFGINNVFNKRDPDNFSVTPTGTQRNDPDARYVYVSARFEF